MATMGRVVAQAAAAFMARAAAQILILRPVMGALIRSLARVINSSRGLSDQSEAAERWTVSRIYHQSV